MAEGGAHIAGLIAAALMGAGLYARAARLRGAPARAVSASLLMILPLLLILPRAFVFFTRISFLLPQKGWAGLVELDPEGLSFTGALYALLLGGFLAERLCRLRPHTLLDPLCPGALMGLLIARLSEFFSQMGQGSEVSDPAFQFFPLAVQNEWGEWYIAVFMLEALAALLLLIDAASQPRPAGEGWQRALLLFFCAQMLCESLRADAIRWGFVRVQQLFCAMGVAALLGPWLLRARRLRLRPALRLAPALIFPCVIALLVGLEFALDRWVNTPHWLLYAVMAAALALLGWAGIRLLAGVKSETAGDEPRREAQPLRSLR